MVLKEINMRKFIFILLLTIAFIQICYASEDKNQIKIINGIVIQDGKALYIDPDEMEDGGLIISESLVNRSKTDILKNSIISFIDGNRMYTYDSKRSEPYWEISESKTEYFYKIVHNQFFISKDKIEWGKVTVNIINIYDNKITEVDKAPVYMTISLKSKYFKGEYDLVGTPNSEPINPEKP
jgi:hypothetical protein